MNSNNPIPTKSLTVFLDRDGVINVDSPDYIKSPDEFHFIPGSAKAIAMLSQGGCHVIVISNQSAIGRGMISLDDLERIFAKMRRGVAQAGGNITDILFCPHRPDEGCRCRKPAPGLFHDAASRHNLDLSRSVMVGDSAKDIAAARAAGCGQAILVLSGKDPQHQSQVAKSQTPPDVVKTDLMAAAKWILSQRL